MDINDIGTTAFVIAYFRAQEEKRADPLFRDPYAQWFLYDEIMEKARETEEIFPEIREIIRHRTHTFNNFVEQEIGNGVEQVVIVGAGFDMRPVIFRADGVSFYDVDQTAVLAYKRDILQQHGIEPWTAVPCNYVDVNLPETLAAAGCDPGKRTLFLWEGNTMYLPHDVIAAFLKQLREGFESFGITFDYFSNKVITRDTGVESMSKLTDFFERNLKAPWITGIDDLDKFARHHGFQVMESGSMDRIVKLRVPEAIYSYCLLLKA